MKQNEKYCLIIFIQWLYLYLQLRPRGQKRKKEEITSGTVDPVESTSRRKSAIAARRKRRTASFEAYDNDEDSYGWSKGDKLRLIQALQKFVLFYYTKQI